MLPFNDLTFISDLSFFMFLISFTFSVRLFNSLYLFWGFGLRMYLYFFRFGFSVCFFGPIIGHV